MVLHLVVITGPMFAGKTTELMRRLHRYELAGKNVLLFKPKLDIRSGSGQVKSHDGKSMGAIEVSLSADILKYVDEADDIAAVGIDEAQFLDGNLVRVVRILRERGIDIFVAGLDMDYRGEPFGYMPQLMAMADEVVKLKAVCVVCGADATHSFKKRLDDKVIEVGGSELYEPRCFKCWLDGMQHHVDESSS
jgi:thymidine kinase